jgi:DNA-binding HxlR family transcriptional regulator
MKSLKDTLTQRRTMTVTEKEAIVEQIHSDAKPEKVPVRVTKSGQGLHRLTLDLPIWLVEKMRLETERNGQTMKGMMLTMLLDRFKD